MTMPATRPEVAAPEAPVVLGLVRELRDELAEHAVRYCHFKSNDMLAKSLDGRNDLDLLVCRRDVSRFLGVLARLGFHRALAPAGRDHPGVAHYFGLDLESGVLVHVHAHFQLVVGDDATKNFRLPIETAYVTSADRSAALPIPAPEVELAVFVVRMILKHATWDAVALGNGTLGAAELAELRWLMARADRGACADVVAALLPGIGTALWNDCLDALLASPQHPLRRTRLGGRLITALRPHGRRGRSHDTAVRILRRVQWGLTWYLLRRPARKRLQEGGLSIAIVGGDGAGKSTAVAELAQWLGGTFVVHQTHLGRPRPSVLTLTGKPAVAALRRLQRRPSRPGAERPMAPPDAGEALWHVLTARDRLREYRKLRRVCDAGGLVVSDRWPLPQLRQMDGARVGWVLDQDQPPESALVRRLARLERRLYADIASPDVLIVLSLDPEVAVLRRPEDDPDYVRRRNGEVYSTDWSRTGAVVVDASQAPGEVLAAIREAVWKRL